MLVAKNTSYGNSVMAPVRVFAKGMSIQDMIAVRMDDKISRIMNGEAFPGDNDVKDLTGYLLLELVRERLEAPNA